jgi:hypothetical protein
MVQVIYKLFLGVLLATTIGMGIATFYQAPDAPEYPRENPNAIIDNPSPGQTKEQLQYERDYDGYSETNKVYDRNVAMIAVILSLVVLALSLTVLSKVSVIADGLLLGGIFTLLYGIIRSFGPGEEKFIFLTTLVGLITVLVLGYLRFIKPTLSAESAAKPSRNKK